MLLPTILLALSSIAGFATSQSIDPSNISEAIRQTWCNNQMSSCPLICLQLPGTSENPDSNECDADTLQYSCVCSNGITPNTSEYTLTMPYYLCTEFNNQCVRHCGDDSSCVTACRADHPCGAQNPKRVNTTSTAPTASQTGTPSGTNTGGVVYTGLGEGATSAPGKGTAGHAVALHIGQVYGAGVLVAAFLLGFSMLV
ncbi:hypothetical protein I7I51_06571 [Histoplasma capsulatum]|uniref:DUF7707 domain-containing protein n=1 Tax=Ajellomyces capsulatus TaxID=5037 RepID=A0A8A1MM60_AJECA|nr:predicted protein [Histoplasma mississippiense (nom. inval.)]EDN06190.1 predicted protein [Histoplasma mississippiense (nom. inval.)]QSS65723.1 hypothetical protein I7I51_06571 [Histoplasma capsulatum]